MMIKKYILITVSLFLLYNLFVYLAPLPTLPQNQWQQNVIRAQEYIYDPKADQIVIVGSSMAARLDGDLLPKNCYNLSFGGQSVQDGLEIIRKSHARPRAILIEANILTAPVNKPFIDGLFTPVLYSLRKVFPALRERNQPVCIVAGCFQRTIQLASSMARYFSLLPGIQVAPHKPAEILDEDQRKVRAELIAYAVEENNRTPEKTFLLAQRNILIQYRQFLKTTGIPVLLFEMPVDPRLRSTANYSIIRELTHDIFDPRQYTYLERIDNHPFNTTDGVHLDRSSATAFTAFFAEEISKQTRILH